MFHGYSHAHIANILLHICGGTVALAAGLLALLAAKGGGLHVKAGRAFMYAYVVIVVTAVLGVAVFEFRSFLAVATIASGYSVFAGYRALRLRGSRPHAVDLAFAAGAFVLPGVFIVAMRELHKPWSPGLTWSVLGGLLLVSAYDLSRTWLPMRWLKRVWVEEHLYKMMAAYIAVVSTAAGTILPRYMPWAALVPVMLGYAVMIGYLIVAQRYYPKRREERLVAVES